MNRLQWSDTYDWDSPGHAGEGRGRKRHDNEDSPAEESAKRMQQKQIEAHHSVRLPVSPTVWYSGESGRMVGRGV